MAFPRQCPDPMSQSEFDVACLTVRLGAIAENYRTLRSLASGAVVAGVVKADGYGLGAAQSTKTLLAEGCDTFFVARLEEGHPATADSSQGPHLRAGRSACGVGAGLRRA